MKKVRVKDHHQSYTYELSEPIGKHFDPEFKPDLTPKQMLKLGVFGGVYMLGVEDEFPKDWLEKAQVSESGEYEKDKNYFGVKASQSLDEWKKKGWIHRNDPRGWFQWYCRYYMGRRTPEEDQRQIKRWKAIKRHVAQIVHNCRRGDETCRPVQRQAVLHWAYDSRKL